ncbi:hypothetical protein NONO_c17540 [Nocardia nova SH22a]|uniref:Uncharacterized protein n=1 Tax=Nocardia nova SH22a TaxID=1415166 RepID=W5TBM1_9NOCA|nr:hypothetical protein [Nocardia nova]AHH16554.1 hypothetical protein NONO_c17540 [Nocardia nova SH22a]
MSTIPSKQAFIESVAGIAALARELDQAGMPVFAQQARAILARLGYMAGDVAHGRPVVNPIELRAVGECGQCIAGVITDDHGRLAWCPNGCGKAVRHA